MRIMAIFEGGITETSTVGKGLTFEDMRNFMVGKKFFIEFQERTCLAIKIIEA